MSINLITDRLVLRPWQDSDAAELYKYAKEDKVAYNCGFYPHKDIEDSRRIIREVLSEKDTFAIVLKESNLPVGSIGIHTLDNSKGLFKEDERMIGYWIGIPYWGRGLVPEAVKELLRYAFTVYNYSGIWCSYYDGNFQSARVIEKCGFSYLLTDDCETRYAQRREHYCFLSYEDWKKQNKVS